MKNKVLKIAVVIILIMVMTMSDFILVGMNIVKALQSIDNTTNHANVKFAVYFQTEDKKNSEAEWKINSDEMKLYMEVAVKNEGYFDGVITLEDSNFKFKQEILSEGISKIEGNTITLNHLTAENTITLEVGIEPIIEESYDDDMLNKESTIKLTGDYKDSEEENTSIESEKNVALSLLVPSNIETTLEGEVITNRIYQIGESNKRIIQIELNSQVVENVYPIKTTTFEVALPEGVEQVEVISKGTYATNGDVERILENSEYEHDEENETLTITLENSNKDGKISWTKDAMDNLIVTLILAENTKINEEEYNVKSIIEFQGEEEKKLEKEIKYNLTEEADGLIRASIENKEIIYKGKIYSGEEREYNSITKIEINYANLIENSILEEKVVYRTETEEKQANIEYKTTTISKSEIDKILGEEGQLIIKDQFENEITTITKDTQIDENGNIIIAYPKGVKALIVEITKAEETGIIRLKHSKVIKPESYTREEIETFKSLVEQVKVAYQSGETTILSAEYSFERIKDLRDTTSEVAITVIPQTISAEESEELEVVLTLKTNDEKYELFANPTFTLTMPEGVTINNLSAGTISATAEELTISKLERVNEKEIRLELLGEQSKYVTSDINAQISFTANVDIEKLMPNKVDTVKMQYTNKDETYNIESESINIIASNAKVVTHLQIENYNNFGTMLERYSDSEEIVVGEIPVENTEIIEAPIKYTMINNYDSTIVVTPSIVAKRTDKEENEQEIMNYSTEEIVIEPGKMQLIEQTLQIPAEMYYSETVDIEARAEYIYSGTKYNVVNTINLITEEKEGIRDISIIDNKIQLETFMQLGDKSGVKAIDEIYNEQIINYIVEVTNITKEPISNLVITNNQENGNIYDLAEVEVTNIAVQEGTIIEHRYNELDTNTKTFEIQTLNPGESRELVCKVVVKKTEKSNITSANISISANGIVEQSIEKISNTVKDSKLKILSRRALNEEVQIYANSSYLIETELENLTSEELKDIAVRIHLSEGLTYNETYPIEALDENEQVLNIIDNIVYNQEENYIDLKVKNLTANQKIILTSMLHIENITLDEVQKDVTVYLEVNGIVANDVISNIEQMETAVTVLQSINVNAEQALKDNDIVIIKGEITNVGNIKSSVAIEDEVPTGLEINKVTLIKNGERIDKTDAVANNALLTVVDLVEGETIHIEIEATVNTSKIVIDKIENTIFVQPFASEEVASNTITLTIESTIDNDDGNTSDYDKPGETNPGETNPGETDPGETDPGETNPGETNPGETNPGEIDPEDKNNTISGNIWVDKNGNNVKDNGESLKNVTVKIIDLNNQNTFLKDENGNEIEVKTNENGAYVIENIENGKYNIIFKYDTSLYELIENKDAKDYIIATTGEKVAITNNIVLDSDITVDLQLVELKEFNLKINKYINKVIVQTQKETKTVEYTKQQLVREEIQTKYLSGATVLVEYTIEISNIGELAGYATEILDYLPSDMEYHSELNTEWYIGTDGNLYNSSLATVSINPGESKTIKLVLLKTMTKDNTGTTVNIAKISDTMNIKEYTDIDLTDNESKAEIIINPATGSIISYLIVVVNCMLIVAIGAYVIKKKVIK